MSETKPVLQLTNAQIDQGSSLILADVNLSIYKGDNPVVCRLVLQKNKIS